MLTNLFGDLGLDSTLKRLMNVISRFTFDASGQLRVGGSVGVSGSLTTVSTVTTANISIGDSGKASTIILQSAQAFQGTVGRNFVRSSGVSEW